MTLTIEKDGKLGSITYTGEPVVYGVTFPDSSTQQLIEMYLGSIQGFKIPEDAEIDNYREEWVMPSVSKEHFEMALSQLWGATEVTVDWTTRREN